MRSNMFRNINSERIAVILVAIVNIYTITTSFSEEKENNYADSGVKLLGCCAAIYLLYRTIEGAITVFRRNPRLLRFLLADDQNDLIGALQEVHNALQLPVWRILSNRVNDTFKDYIVRLPATKRELLSDTELQAFNIYVNNISSAVLQQL